MASELRINGRLLMAQSEAFDNERKRADELVSVLRELRYTVAPETLPAVNSLIRQAESLVNFYSDMKKCSVEICEDAAEISNKLANEFERIATQQNAAFDKFRSSTEN